MQNKLTSLLLGTVIVLSIGIVGVYSYFDGEVSSALNSQTAGSFMTGHLAMTVTGPDGIVKQYVQTDNFILPTGEDCAMKKLFVGSGQTGSTVSDICPNNVGVFDVIALLIDDGAPCNPVSTAIALNSDNCQLLTANTLAPQSATVDDTTTDAAAGDTVPHLNLDFTFLPTGTSIITGAAVTNTTSTTDTNHEVFAKAQVSPSVTVNNGDSLTVEWDIEIGGTASI